MITTSAMINFNRIGVGHLHGPGNLFLNFRQNAFGLFFAFRADNPHQTLGHKGRAPDEGGEHEQGVGLEQSSLHFMSLLG